MSEIAPTIGRIASVVTVCAPNSQPISVMLRPTTSRAYSGRNAFSAPFRTNCAAWAALVTSTSRLPITSRMPSRNIGQRAVVLGDGGGAETPARTTGIANPITPATRNAGVKEPPTSR